jgi:hypothetical protein
MAEIVHERLLSLAGAHGKSYAWVRTYASATPAGTWEGHLEFLTDTGERVVTQRETTQSKLEDVAYWAAELESVYLEGALRRALDRMTGRMH